MEEIKGHRIPYSAAAEQAVIGSMLIDPACVPNVMEKLRSDELYVKLNRDIFETVSAMFSFGHTYVNTHGYYWTGTNVTSYYVYQLAFSQKYQWEYNYRYNGYQMRGVRKK